MIGNSFSNIRAALQDIDPGEWTDLNIAPITVDEFKRWFEVFQKNSARKYEWEPSKSGVKITCVFGRKGGTKYGLETLGIGDSMMIEVPERSIHRVRQSASWLRSQTGQSFRIQVVPGGVEATRLEDDTIVDGKIIKASRQAEYLHPIDGLEVGQHLIVSLEAQPRTATLRAYCSYHGRVLGREFKVTKEIEAGRHAGHCITRTA